MGNCNAKVKEAPDIGTGPPSELALMKKMELKRVLDADGIKRQVWFCCNIASLFSEYENFGVCRP